MERAWGDKNRGIAKAGGEKQCEGTDPKNPWLAVGVRAGAGNAPGGPGPHGVPGAHRREIPMAEINP